MYLGVIDDKVVIVPSNGYGGVKPVMFYLRLLDRKTSINSDIDDDSFNGTQVK